MRNSAAIANRLRVHVMYRFEVDMSNISSPSRVSCANNAIASHEKAR